jgi:hypothetical protein
VHSSESLRLLVDLNAPLWAAEAEVIRTYWHSPQRSRETDRLWLVRQSYKEFWDGFHRAFEHFNREIHRIDRDTNRHVALDQANVLREELAHYCWFADLYDELREVGEPLLDPQTCKRLGSWAENDELMRLRTDHRKRHADLGTRAQRFTEGGYCALYREGMKLADNGGFDGRIAAACAAVYADELDHMLAGIAGIDEMGLTDAEWRLLGEISVAQLQQRIRMRNAQFNHPVTDRRLAELCAGACEPVQFDYARAGRQAAARLRLPQ